LLATVLLVALELGVLAGIKHQTRHDRNLIRC
jgi:hypothetical protein